MNFKLISDKLRGKRFLRHTQITRLTSVFFMSEHCHALLFPEESGMDSWTREKPHRRCTKLVSLRGTPSSLLL